MRRYPRRLGGHTSGATSLEFALAAIPLFLLLLGIIESGLLFWSWQALQAAAIDAGHCAANNFPACAHVATTPASTASYAATAAQQRGLNRVTSSNVSVTTGTAAQSLCGSTTASVVSILMTYQYPMISFIKLPSSLSASACFPLSS
jgi:Flp pilus assembly protein TadG